MNVFNYLFEESRFSNNDFLVGNKEQISYEKLFQDTIVLANWIRVEYGVDNKIILVSPNSVFFITVYLAILKSGNICVPLNPAIEPQNLEYIKEQCEATILFVATRLKDTRWKDFTHIHDEQLLETPSALDSSHYLLFEEPFSGDRLAEIIFTSGSTGKPKGVMVSHKNIASNTSSIIEYLSLTATDTIEIVLPFYYCYGLSLLHTHLRVGGSAVFNNSFIFIGSVIDDLNRYKCTGFAGVPSHFQILLRKATSFKTSSFPHLKYVTQAGGKLHKTFQKEFKDSFPEIDFFVMYGQTEATARLSYMPPEKLEEKLGSIGTAIPGVELELFDENDNPINEPGTMGELVAKGDNIMLGYLNDPEGTKAALKNGWLHTNDLAYRDEDGFFYLTSRKQEIIKVGGERISPKEIEEVIVSLPEVVDCSVSGIFDENLGEVIKAEIVIADPSNTELTELDVKTYCSKHLSIHKIPQLIQFNSRLEVAATGKKVKAT